MSECAGFNLPVDRSPKSFRKMSLCSQALVFTLVLTSRPTVKGRQFQEEIKFTSSVDGVWRQRTVNRLGTLLPR